MFTVDLDTVSTLKDGNPTTTSYDVSWDKAEGILDGYIVECNCTETDPSLCNDHRSLLLSSDNTSYICTGLTPGATYITHVNTVRTNWDDVTQSLSEKIQTSM